MTECVHTVSLSRTTADLTVRSRFLGCSGTTRNDPHRRYCPDHHHHHRPDRCLRWCRFLRQERLMTQW
ncbi:hypothetical protein KIPB_006303 [Kipferlia bialata]|uniref:Uncharacterized protein n=1 Tax=Kipferlia bialata TaxID=797122 RepID=A0A9K3CX33_9EUKA|nr:hypothetical protein KIPB_006303 [Kipferlia bialata]|eukprot:g6303.t1